MCGLAGVFGVNAFPQQYGLTINGVKTAVPNQGLYLKRNLSILLHISQLRGQDSSGVFFTGGAKEGEVLVAKDTCTSSTFIATKMYDKAITADKWNIGIGHSRAATLGGMTYDSAHPHVYGPITLVHNGTIRNHHLLFDGCPQGVSDSSAMAWYLSQIELDTPSRMFANLPDFGAVIWFDSRDNSLNIAKDDSRTLYWTHPGKKHKGAVTHGYLSSQREALEFVRGEGCSSVREVPCYTHWKFKDGEMKAFDKWDKYVAPPVQTQSFGATYQGKYGSYYTRISDASGMDALLTAGELDEYEAEAATDQKIQEYTLEKGSKIRVNNVFEVGASRPLKASYRCPFTEEVYEVFIDQPPLSLFEEYEELLDKGGVIEVKYTHGTKLYAKVIQRPIKTQLKVV